jgi:hypothetical protein
MKRIVFGLKPSITQSAAAFNQRRALWLQVCGARDGLRGSQALGS